MKPSLPLTLAFVLCTLTGLGARSALASGHGGGQGKPEPAGGHGGEPAGPEVQLPSFEGGVALGVYSIKDVRTGIGLKQRLNFAIHADLEGDEAEAFRKRLAPVEKRFRNEVLAAVRACPAEAFQEPTLFQLARRIVARVRRTMPELGLKGVVFTAFEYFED